MKTLDETELKNIADRLAKLEQDTLYDTGVKRISGGFAVAEMDGYDDDYVDVKLKWGVQSDVEDNSHTEHITLIRETLEEK